MNSFSARRRHPLATAGVLLLALLATGGLYALLAPQGRAEAAVRTATGAQQGRALFLANCATCHGPGAEGTSDGPTLVGVGAASVDFQVMTGRMPAYTNEVSQVPKSNRKLFSQTESDQLADYVASLGPGPAIPAEKLYSTDDVTPAQVAAGGETFRTNCAMCHNAAGSGGALTNGKYAPSLHGSNGRYIYEAMLTGPQSMPVFGDTVTPTQKKEIVAYLTQLDDQPSFGGLSLGAVGPLSEGAFLWVVGVGALIGVAVWLGAKSA